MIARPKILSTCFVLLSFLSSFLRQDLEQEDVTRLSSVLKGVADVKRKEKQAAAKAGKTAPTVKNLGQLNTKGNARKGAGGMMSDYMDDVAAEEDLQDDMYDEDDFM